MATGVINWIKSYNVGPPEVLMKNGNNRQLFSLQTLSPLLGGRSLSIASFSELLPGCPHHLALTFLSAGLICPPWSCRECPVHWGQDSSQNVIYCPTCAFSIIVLLFFMAPEKKHYKGGPQPQPWSRPGRCPAQIALMAQLNQAYSNMLSWICQWWCASSRHHLDCGSAEWGLTLADESLAGVQQNITAFYNHSFYGKVLPYVFSVTHFIMHYPVRHNTYRITARDTFYCPCR